MADPHALISSVHIARDQVCQLLEQAGAYLFTDQERIREPYDGRLSHGPSHVWVVLHEEDWRRGLEADQIAQIKQALGAEPLSYILLDIGRHQADIIAVAFACRCAEHFPLVLYDLHSTLYSAPELCERSRHGKGLYSDEGQ